MAKRKIKITQCSGTAYWYAPFVGKEILSNRIWHNGDANISNKITTGLRGVPTLDGIVVKGDYELI